jgi:hypothetical protein
MAGGRGRLAFALALAAVCWSALVLVAAFWAPAYEGESTSGGGVTHTSATLVAVNGLRGAVLLAVPLVLALAAAIGLHRRCAQGSAAGAAAAWLAVGLLAVLSLLGAASIGPLVAPATLLLAAAARVTPAG